MAKSEPLVSICSISFNHASYIKQCLDGFLMQETSFDFEILIHDDASTDGTQKIIKDYQKKYPDLIKPILQTENQYSKRKGGGMNIDYNFNRAKGKYIAMCEGDDYWTDPLKLQKQVGFLAQHPEFVLVHHDDKVVDEKGQLLKETRIFKENRRDFTALELQKGPFLSTMSLCFRNIIKDYPNEFYQVLNGDKFLISLLGNYGKAKFMGDITPGVYRIHTGGIWSTVQTRNKQEAVLNTSEKLNAYYNRMGNKDLAAYFDKKADAVKMLLILGHLQEGHFGRYFKTLVNYFSSRHNLFFKLYHCPAAHIKFLKKSLG